MRLVLSGTSNSIIANGLNKGLAGSVSRFENRSFGASGTVAIGDHMRSIDFAGFDACVVDYAVNEEHLIRYGATDVESGISNVSAMIDAASLLGCRTVLTVLPCLHEIGNDRPFEKAIERLAAEGVACFNGYRLLDRLCHLTGADVGDFFLDPMHLKRELACFIGRSIAEILAETAGPRRPRRTNRTYAPLTFLENASISVDGRHERIFRETRIASAHLTRILPGSRFRIPQPADQEAIGLSYNAARTTGYLHRYDREVFRIPYSSLFTSARELTLIALPFPAPLQIDGSECAIDFVAGDADPSKDLEPALEISGVIFRGRDELRPLHVVEEIGDTPRLDELIPDGELSAIAGRVRAS